MLTLFSIRRPGYYPRCVIFTEQRNYMSSLKNIKYSVIGILVLLGTVGIPAQQAFSYSSTSSLRTAAVSRDCFTAVNRHWPAHLRPWARSIVWRESRNTPSAANPRSSARGCFQMLLRYSSRFYRSVGCNNYMWANPDCNARAAYAMYRVAGRSPWRL
jgi:hypothetical protein